MENLKKEAWPKTQLKSWAVPDGKLQLPKFVTHQSCLLPFDFCPPPPPPLLLFLPRLFFCWAFTRPFFWWEEFLRKLQCMRMGNETRLSCPFPGERCMIFSFSPASLSVSRSLGVRFERSLPLSQERWQSCPWPWKRIASQALEGMWICVGGYGQFMGEWLRTKNFKGQMQRLPRILQSHPRQN